MQVKIDTRPLPIVILSRWWRFPVFALVSYSLYHFYQQPPPEGLSVAGFRALIVFLDVHFSVDDPAPAITGDRTLCPGCPVAARGDLPEGRIRLFWLRRRIFHLGVFMLAAALYKSGLSTRMALHLLKSGSKSPRRLVFQVMLTSALLSFIMSEHAVAAMMFPLVVIISKRLSSSPEGRTSTHGSFFSRWHGVASSVVSQRCLEGLVFRWRWAFFRRRHREPRR